MASCSSAVPRQSFRHRRDRTGYGAAGGCRRRRQRRRFAGRRSCVSIREAAARAAVFFLAAFVFAGARLAGARMRRFFVARLPGSPVLPSNAPRGFVLRLNALSDFFPPVSLLWSLSARACLRIRFACSIAMKKASGVAAPLEGHSGTRSRSAGSPRLASAPRSSRDAGLRQTLQSSSC